MYLFRDRARTISHGVGFGSVKGNYWVRLSMTPLKRFIAQRPRKIIRKNADKSGWNFWPIFRWSRYRRHVWHIASGPFAFSVCHRDGGMGPMAIWRSDRKRRKK